MLLPKTTKFVLFCKIMPSTNREKNQRHTIPLIDLPTSTIGQTFSVTKVLLYKIFNKMDEEFLARNLVVNIKRKIAQNYSSNSILEFVILLIY